MLHYKQIVTFFFKILFFKQCRFIGLFINKLRKKGSNIDYSDTEYNKYRLGTRALGY